VFPLTPALVGVRLRPTGVSSRGAFYRSGGAVADAQANKIMPNNR
jgi:hypothetical protein